MASKRGVKRASKREVKRASKREAKVATKKIGRAGQGSQNTSVDDVGLKFERALAKLVPASRLLRP